MNKTVKEQWVGALRPGKYQQVAGQLGNDSGHCCLGVLCELAVSAGRANKRVLSSGSFVYGNESGYETQMSPIEVCGWAGLPIDPSLPFYDSGEHNRLSAINDSGVPFEEIASLIERYL